MAYILIVDDDEIIAEMAADALMEAGHACGWVTSGDQALELLKWRRPDLMLLDQDMPEMTGSQVLRKLRTSDKFYDLPVIMFTALTGEQDEEQAIYAGAQDYIRKPFSNEALLWAVDELLRKRAKRGKHIDLKTVLEQNTGRWVDPEEIKKRAV